jgi:hypothetical protein
MLLNPPGIYELKRYLNMLLNLHQMFHPFQ